jgi:hypothetical protein
MITTGVGTGMRGNLQRCTKTGFNPGNLLTLRIHDYE